jgi:ferredoxin
VSAVALRIEIDHEKCMGQGQCIYWAPATFDLGEDGLARVTDVDGDPLDKIVLGAKGCPTGAITVFQDDEQVV